MRHHERLPVTLAVISLTFVLGVGCQESAKPNDGGGAGDAANAGAGGSAGVAGEGGAGGAAGLGAAGAAGVNAGAGSGGTAGEAGTGGGGAAGEAGSAGTDGNDGPPYERACTVEQPTECKLCETQTTCEAPTFTANGDGTVTSSCCGQVWQQNTEWVPDANNEIADCLSNPHAAGCYTWDAAVAYCAGLSLAGGGWRLPTIAELVSLEQFTNTGSAGAQAFPNAAIWSPYWSSTTYSDDSNRAWTATFTGGEGAQDAKTTENFVRCVR